MSKYTEFVGVYVAPELAARLREVAERLELSRSQVFRKALSLFLRKNALNSAPRRRKGQA